MIRNRLSALGLAALLACSSSAFAGSTGPTNPETNGPKVPATGIEKNIDRDLPGAKGTSPAARAMDPEPTKDTDGRDRSHEPQLDKNLPDDEKDDGNAP